MKIKWDKNTLDQIEKNAVQSYISEHSNECAICHNPVKVEGNLPDNALPICEQCEKKIKD